ncbi:hypothetical protein ACM614_17375 [Streptomyces sp. 12297]
MTPQSVVCADSVSRGCLTGRLTMWTDDYAAQCGQPGNTPVEELLARYRRPYAVTGRALFTGPFTDQGVEGLTFDQVVVVLDRLMTHEELSVRALTAIPAQRTR